MSSIQFHYQGIKPTIFSKIKTEKVLKQIVNDFSLHIGDINVIFCSDEEILKINRKFLNHDYPTDIITFDYCSNGVVSGDLFIGLNVVKENALEYKVPFKEEIYRVIVHGVLHLVGLNDKTKNEKIAMRKKENLYLVLIK